MFHNLWERTKKVASMYTGTFIVVMILNQLLFFGFCLNPICLIAAMPHVLLITVVIGSGLNKMNNWGRGEVVEADSTSTPSCQDKLTPSEPPISEKIENGEQKNALGMYEWYRLAAEQGHADAQYNLGVMYRKGEGVTQDKAEAVRWFRMTAEQGDAEAQVNLGWMYDNGEGVTQDYAEAVKWYRMAAEQGDALAQFNLGVMYSNGKGVTQDDTEAVRWYRLAAEQGHAKAQFNLGVMYDMGEGVPEDDAEAVKWYRMAAEQGYAKAQNTLGVMYSNGEGVPEDDAEAVKWYRLAAEQGHAKAQNSLENLYAEGWGVAQVVNSGLDNVGLFASTHLKNVSLRQPDQPWESLLSERAKVIQSYAHEIQIPHLVHFTQAKNLPSITKHGLCSIDYAEQVGIEPLVNDQLRLDGHPNGISVSIAFPNYKMFYKYRMQNTDTSWVVLVIDPSVLWRNDCAFYKYNAADKRVMNLSLDSFKTADKFKEMFTDIDGKPSRKEQNLKLFNTTDVQAEVLVFDVVKPHYIVAVVFDSMAEKEKNFKYLGDRKIEIHTTTTPGFFSSRDYFNRYYKQTPVQFGAGLDNEIPF